MSKIIRIIIICLFLGGLISIRLFENQLFPEVFISFFKSKFTYAQPPNFSFKNVLLITSARYALNSALSIGIIYFLFISKKTLQFSLWFYGIAFIFLMLIFCAILYNLTPAYYRYLFYVRRFLIQPLFLILLVPALYYQKKISSS